MLALKTRYAGNMNTVGNYGTERMDRWKEELYLQKLTAQEMFYEISLSTTQHSLFT